MAVGAGDRRAGQSEAEFRADDVDDALVGIADIEQPDARRRAMVARRGDKGVAPGDEGSGSTWLRVDDVVDSGEHPRRIGDGRPASASAASATDPIRSWRNSRSTAISAPPSASGATTCASHSLAKRVRAVMPRR